MPTTAAERIATRRQTVARRCRTGLWCCLAGLVVAEAILATGIEWSWLGVRDPDYAELIDIVRKRRAESPNRPLVLAIGSSSTFEGIDGERLSRPGDAVVVNCGFTGAGPINHQIMLRRFLDDGVRPDL